MTEVWLHSLLADVAGQISRHLLSPSSQNGDTHVQKSDFCLDFQIYTEHNSEENSHSVGIVASISHSLSRCRRPPSRWL